MYDYSVLNEEKLRDLRIGDSFSSFADFCRKINVPIPKGSSKPAFVKTLAQFLEFDVHGRSMVISRIYQKALPREGSAEFKWLNSIFDDPTVAMAAITNYPYLNDEGGKTIVTTYSVLRAINITFEEIKSLAKGEKLEDLSKNGNYFLVRNHLPSLLSFWESRGYISSYSPCILFDNGSIKSDVFEQRLEIFLDTGRFVATVAEEEEIRQLNETLLAEFSCSSLSELIRKGQWFEFEKQRAALSAYKYVRVRNGFSVMR